MKVKCITSSKTTNRYAHSDVLKHARFKGVNRLMNRIFILIFCFYLSACIGDKVLFTWKGAPGIPKEWLKTGFNEKPFENTLNFYITNNPWSGSFERALSISDTTGYLVVVIPGEPYEFKYHEIVFVECSDLRSAKANLEKQLKRYSDNPALAKEEAIYWFDGPDYTLERYGKASEKPIYSRAHELNGYGNIVPLANKLLKAAEECVIS